MPDTNSMILQKIFNSKQCNALNTSDLGGGIARQIIHSHFLQTTCSDATRRHLTDLSCPCRTRLSGMLSRQSPLRLVNQGNR